MDKPYGRYLEARSGPARPERLYAPRTRDHHGGWQGRHPGRWYIGLRSPLREEALERGEILQDTDGACYALKANGHLADDSVLAGNEPFCFRPRVYPLQTDLIPATSWGGSLANLLTRRHWNRIREPVLERFGRQCELCGERNGHMECHEQWDYFAPLSAEAHSVGVQKLLGFYALCGPCHEMFHLGRAGVVGHRDQVLARLCRMNSWSEKEGDEAWEWLGAMWLWRNQFQWALDLSVVRNYQPLEITDACKVIPETTWVYHANKGGEETSTALLGVAWSCQSVTYRTIYHESIYACRG